MDGVQIGDTTGVIHFQITDFLLVLKDKVSELLKLKITGLKNGMISTIIIIKKMKVILSGKMIKDQIITVKMLLNGLMLKLFLNGKIMKPFTIGLDMTMKLITIVKDMIILMMITGMEYMDGKKKLPLETMDNGLKLILVHLITLENGLKLNLDHLITILLLGKLKVERLMMLNGKQL